MSGLEERAESTNGFKRDDTGSNDFLALQRLHSQSPLGIFLGSTGGSLDLGEGENYIIIAAWNVKLQQPSLV